VNRGALRVVLILVVSLALPKAFARAQDSEAQPVSKKEAAWATKLEASKTPATAAEKKAWHKRLAKRVGKRPTASVNIYNKWTHEYLVFDAGDTRQPPADVANRFLRCHFTNQPTQMDQRLVSVLLQAAKKFNVRRVDVVSGFRDPKYNLTLRKKGRQVARNSEHTLGHAVDFRLPGIGVNRLHAWARTLRLGGVGFYKSSRFIHVDVGKVRYWNGS
jgi:uncharacterized protein YcbK (DUF882 family)